MKKLIAAALLFSPAVAFAQAQPAPKQPTTTIIFDGEDVSATKQAPGGVIVDALPSPKHTSILQVRESFADKVLDSSKELR